MKKIDYTILFEPHVAELFRQRDVRRRTKTRVITPDGTGKIIGYDQPDLKGWRYIVRLDRNPYPGTKRACYFPHEIRLDNESTISKATSHRANSSRGKNL